MPLSTFITYRISVSAVTYDYPTIGGRLEKKIQDERKLKKTEKFNGSSFGHAWW
jgi:uncharacterized membrane protein